MIFSTKNDIRKKYLNKRKDLSSQSIEDLSEKIFKNYISKFKPFKSQNIHIFLSIPEKHEITTNLWINFFWRNNINVFVPKIKKDKIFSIKYSPETVLTLNKWGILEPEGNNYEDNDLNFSQVITPLVYADIFGNRVGYGKGFYDNFFSSMRQSTKKIGLGFFAPKEIISDIEVSDIPLDYLILPESILSFSENPLNFIK